MGTGHGKKNRSCFLVCYAQHMCKIPISETEFARIIGADTDL